MKEQFDALVARLNEASNKLATTLADLRDKLAAGGMTKADEEAAVASLTSAVATLEALGADPANPVPEEPAPEV